MSFPLAPSGGTSCGNSLRRVLYPIVKVTCNLLNLAEAKGTKYVEANTLPGSDFGWIVDAYHEKIYRSACMLLMNRHEAEDLTQDVFLAAMKSYSRFRGESSLYTWLYKIMLNLFRKRRSRKRLLQWNIGPSDDEQDDFQVLFADDGDTPEEAAEKAERSKRVADVLKSLSRKHREVVVLRFFEDKSYHEIAAVVGVSEGTVKSRLHHALKLTGGRLQDLKPVRNNPPTA